MANPTSRSTLQEYALRRLGKGVIDINVSTDQIDDRTDEALQFFQEYHFDGVEKTYLKHKVTATTLTVSNSSQFTVGEKITVALLVLLQRFLTLQHQQLFVYLMN